MQSTNALFRVSYGILTLRLNDCYNKKVSFKDKHTPKSIITFVSKLFNKMKQSSNLYRVINKLSVI